MLNDENEWFFVDAYLVFKMMIFVFCVLRWFKGVGIF